MVTYIPGENSWGEAFKQAGSNVGQSYMGRADELAIQNALTKLKPDASPREILDTITGVNTYSPQAKQQALKNYIGAAEFESNIAKSKAEREYKAAELTEKKRQAQVAETAETAKLEETKRYNLAKEKLKEKEIESKKDIETQKTTEKENKEREEVEALYKSQHPKASEEEVKSATKGLKPADMRALITKPENVTEYQVAKNQAERFNPAIKNIQENAEKAKKLIVPTEIAIANNEKYTTSEKYWDTIVGLPDNKFLNLLKSNTGQQLSAYAPIAVSSFSDKMGGVLSVRKINLIEQKAVSPNKDKETNRLFLYMDLADRKLDLLKQQFTDEIIAENKYGLAPKDFNKQIDEKMKPYQKQISSDINLLLEGKKPKSELLQVGIVERKKKNAPPGHVLVVDEKGNEGYLQEDLLGKPGYEDLKKYE